MRRSLLSLLVLLVSLVAEAEACSCGKRSIEQKFSESAYVFVGRVTSTQDIASRADHPDWGGVAAKFTPVRDIKGEARALPSVQSGYGAGDCGVPLLVGTTYLFFAGASGEISICTGTQGYIAGYEPHERLMKRLERASSASR